jgi:hypothetical protein
MASAPQAQLPLFYNDLMPLNSRDHGTWHARSVDKGRVDRQPARHPARRVDEFAQAQRNFPIVFSAGDNPVPLALMGLNEGINVYFDVEGKPLDDAYVPAYIRRYPFLLARLKPDAEEMSLCFDPSCDVLGDSRTARRCSRTASRASTPRACCSSASSSSRPVRGPRRSSRN